MKEVTAIDYLKARASWGITGSDRFAYDYDKYYFKTGISSYFSEIIITLYPVMASSVYLI